MLLCLCCFDFMKFMMCHLGDLILHCWLCYEFMKFMM
jgi:hypothetical protein